jgi:predicted Zn-dependent protease
MYKAGYDPGAFIDFFERMEALEKRKSGTVSELFRSHPNMETRIRFTQKNVQEFLAAQPQYVISTSEFQEVKQNLAMIINGQRVVPERQGPTLRRRPSMTPQTGEGNPRPDQDERPTLKRRDP